MPVRTMGRTGGGTRRGPAQIDYLASTVALLPASLRRVAARADAHAIERDIAELLRHLGVDDPTTPPPPRQWAFAQTQRVMSLAGDTWALGGPLRRGCRGESLARASPCPHIPQILPPARLTGRPRCSDRPGGPDASRCRCARMANMRRADTEESCHKRPSGISMLLAWTEMWPPPCISMFSFSCPTSTRLIGWFGAPERAQTTDSRRSPDALIVTSLASARTRMDRTPASQSTISRRIDEPCRSTG
jgi:hypothetical protein